MLPGEQPPVPAGGGLRLDPPAQAPHLSQGGRGVLNLLGIILNWRQFESDCSKEFYIGLFMSF